MELRVHRIDGGQVVDIEVDGTSFHSDDGELWYAPKSCLRQVRTTSLPDDVWIECCESVEEDVIYSNTIPYRLRRSSGDNVQVQFEEMQRRKFWDADFGLRKYMEAKRDIIADRAKEIGDIRVDSFDDDGDYIFLTYSADISGNSAGQIIDQAEQLIAEVDGATDLELGSPVPKLEDVADEPRFTISVLIPLLRKLGFSNVKYNHGPREFGRDVLFSRLNEFDDVEWWGAQAKFGDVSGSAKSQVDEIIGQLDDAFKVPFYDVYTRRKQYISKLLIAVSGKFTDNAVEKICEKIESAAIRNNLVF